MANLTKKVQAHIAQLAANIVEWKVQRDSLDKDIAAAEQEIRDLTAKGDLPIKDGPSQYLNVENVGSVRVTRQQPRMTIDAGKLRENIKDDEVFLRVVKVKTVDLNPLAWERELERETVTDKMLKDSIKEGATPRAIVVIGEKRG